MKRITTLFLSLIVALTLMSFPTFAESDAVVIPCGENAIITIKDRVLTVSGTGETVAPEELIYENYENSVDTIIVEEGITTIGEYLFWGLNVETVILPKSVHTIGIQAFCYNYSLSKITMPGVKTIENNAFYSCTALESIDLPETLETIGQGAFMCSSLRDTLYVPENVKEIAWDFTQETFLSYFDVSTENPYFTSVDGIIYNKDKTIALICPEYIENTDIILEDTVTEIGVGCFYASGITSIIMPEGLTKISDIAFVYNRLSHISLPDSLEYIGNAAFAYSFLLESFDISKNVSFIGACLFLDSYLKEISVSEENEYFEVENGLLYSKDKSRLLFCPQELEKKVIIINDSCTEIDDSAFAYCGNIEHIKIPNGVKELNYGIFMYCSGLKTIKLPSKLTTIGSSCFMDCNSLSSIKLPETVANIGKGAFANCSSLKYIILPNNIEYIPSYLFSGCSSLSKVFLGTKVLSIADHAFEECDSLTDITLPCSLKSLGLSVFEGDDNLKNIWIPETIEEYEGSFAGLEDSNVVIHTDNYELRHYLKQVGIKAIPWQKITDAHRSVINNSPIVRSVLSILALIFK